MGETTRFEVARAIQRSRPAAQTLLVLFEEPMTSALALFPVQGRPPTPAQLQPPLDHNELINHALQWRSRPDLYVDPWQAGTPRNPDGTLSDAARVVDFLRAFDSWLVAEEGRPALAALLASASSLAVKIGGADPPGKSPTPVQILAKFLELPRWREAWDLLRRSFCALLCPANLRGETPDAISRATARLQRLLLVAGLVADLADKAAPVRGPDDVRDRLLHRIVVVPSPPYPFPRPDDDAALRRLRLLGRSGSSDLYVVREEWACYQPGEIAHIENVLEGESKTRLFQRTDETETTDTRETTSARSEQRDTQTTDRFELTDEATAQAKLAVHVEGKVDTSGRYGPTQVDTHVTGGLDWSKEEASRHATTIAHEVVDHTVTEVEKSVREARVRRTLTRIVESDTHVLDNSVAPDGHVVGVYRWVDKVTRLQLFKYPNRYLLEFQVPEPGAFLRWIEQHPDEPETTTAAPPPFTLDGKALAKDRSNAIRPDNVNVANYAALAAVFGASVDPPPAETVTVAGTAKLAVDEGERKKDTEVKNLVQPPSVTDTIKLVVPDGYTAHQFRVSATGVPIHAIWLDHPVAWDGRDGWHYRDGYHIVAASVVLAGEAVSVFPIDRATIKPATDSPLPQFTNAWLIGEAAPQNLTLPAEREIDATVTLAGAYAGSVSVSVKCQLKKEARTAWEISVYDALRDAHTNWSNQYTTELRALRARQEQIRIDGSSPARNAERVREELKRQVLEQLMGERFQGLDAMASDPALDGMPYPDLDKALDAGPTVQFLEQVVEWDKMTFMLYPYYWAPDTRWKDLEVRESADPEFARFLRSGSARVVVSARPGYAYAVQYWLWYGRPWGGECAPAPGEADYLSVADEIRSLQQAPDDGEPMESWEVRLPTTLVWLDSDPTLPKYNDAARLDPPTDQRARICRPADEE